MKGGRQNPADIIKTFGDEVQKSMGNGFLLTTETIDTKCDADSEEEKMLSMLEIVFLKPVLAHTELIWILFAFLKQYYN